MTNQPPPPRLTSQQIEKLITQAQAAGLDPVSAQALREALIANSLDLGAAGKLAVDILQLANATQARIEGFTAFWDSFSTGVMDKGKSALLAMSDSEWNELLGDSGDGG